MSYGLIGGNAAPANYIGEQAAGRDPQVNGAISGVEFQLDELEKVACALAQRLSPVLNPDEKSDGGIPVPGYSCELANRIQSASQRIRVLRTGLDSVLSRLEI